MKRYELSGSQWRNIRRFLPGRLGSVGVTAKDNRNFVNGVLWVLRSGAEWKNLPVGYGKWKSVHKRFTRWAKGGVWKRIFQVLLADTGTRISQIRLNADWCSCKKHRYVACNIGIFGP